MTTNQQGRGAIMNRDDAHDPLAVANRILDVREEFGSPPTIMQLIKLAYFADGWSLALLNKPLCNEAPEAWQYGPVYRSIYKAFSGSGPKPIKSRAVIFGTDVPVSEDFSVSENDLIKSVVRAYGKLSAYALSNLTHQPNTPWSKAYKNGGYSEIDTAEMKKHFVELKEKQNAKRESV